MQFRLQWESLGQTVWLCGPLNNRWELNGSFPLVGYVGIFTTNRKNPSLPCRFVITMGVTKSFLIEMDISVSAQNILFRKIKVFPTRKCISYYIHICNLEIDLKHPPCYRLSREKVCVIRNCKEQSVQVLESNLRLHSYRSDTLTTPLLRRIKT